MRKRQKEAILISFFKEKEKYEKLAAYSDRLRHPIPIDPATLFRSNPPPDSEAFRHPLGALI
jgi:hypothetical protein